MLSKLVSRVQSSFRLPPLAGTCDTGGGIGRRPRGARSPQKRKPQRVRSAASRESGDALAREFGRRRIPGSNFGHAAPGILLVAHGTPDSLDDIPAFLNNIRRGRPTPPAVVQAVRDRYEAIGGSSPLLTTTRTQAKLLGAQTGLPCFVAMRMWHPTFEEVLHEIALAQAPRELIVVSAAPHSAHVYFAALQETATKLRERGIQPPVLHSGPCWGDNPSYVEAWALAIAREIDRLGVRKTARAVLISTAHSLPMRTVQAGDPYPQLVAETAEAVLQRLGSSALPSMLAFQSQGMSEEPWLGPDLPTVFQRAASTGAEGVVLVPLGFPAEHVETLYDLDIEAQQMAQELGLWMTRVPCLDTDDHLIHAMKTVVDQVLGKLE